jgi:DNA-binding LacI/PurR family transcriptional regulator/signal transduction histidine kinase
MQGPNIGEALTPRGARRPTLAVVTNALAQNYYAQGIIDAADLAAERAGFDLLVFVTGYQRAGDLAAPTNRTLMGALRRDWFDALIALPVGAQLTATELDPFYGRFGGVPICSVAMALPSFPSIVVSGAEGVREAVEHLIRVHGRKRFAVLRGVEGVEEYDQRFRGCLAALEANGVPFDPGLVVATEAYGPQGGEAVRTLLDERGASFDAIVAANDGLALDSLRELRRRGLRVPRDVAVCGFDDAPQARHASPPLTTVRQPLDELGQRAVETVVAALRGEVVPMRQVLQSRLLVRQSCGCVRHTVKRGTKSDAPEAPALPAASVGRRASISPSTRPSYQPLPVKSLRETLRSDVSSSTGEFLEHLRNVLVEAATARGEVGDVHEILTLLRNEELLRVSTEPALRDRLEDLIHAARILVSELDIWAHVEDRSRVYWWALKLNESSEAFTTALSMSSLMGRFGAGIQQFEIPRCMVALFEGVSRAPDEASVILAYDTAKTVVLPREKSRFHCGEYLVPVHLWDWEKRRSYLIEVIHSHLDGQASDTRKDVLGYVVFEMGPRDGLVYQCLRDQISAAIHGLEMWQKLLREVERRQSAEAVYERMASLGRLTAGIAHEMNTPLAAVRAALQQLTTLVEEYRAGIEDPDLNATDNQDIAREMSFTLGLANNAAIRLAEFVRGIRRQTREAQPSETSAFNVMSVVRETLLRFDHVIRRGGCSVRFEAGTSGIELSGDSVSFAQLLSNLVTNAIEASAPKGGGEIVVQIVEKDSLVEVTVSDGGEGIAPENLSRIFEPMFTTRGFGDHSGLGLSIVHDIVTGAFGGSIEVRSDAGHGATFTLRLPHRTPRSNRVG